MGRTEPAVDGMRCWFMWPWEDTQGPTATGIPTSSAFQSPLPHICAGLVSLQPTSAFSLSSAMFAGVVSDHPCLIDQTGKLTQRGCLSHRGKKLWAMPATPRPLDSWLFLFTLKIGTKKASLFCIATCGPGAVSDTRHTYPNSTESRCDYFHFTDKKTSS